MSRPTPSLLVRLQRDWEHLDRSRPCLAAAQRWELRTEPFASLDELLRRAGYGTVARGCHDDDQVLGDLIRSARDDALAARVVLQRLLPGIAAIARRRSGTPVARDETVGELVTAAWTVIRTYPIDARPSYVAANVLRRIDDAAFRRQLRRRAKFTPWPTELFDRSPAEPPGVSAAEELDDLLVAAAAHGMSDDDLGLARRLAAGHSTIAIAADLRVTDRTVRNRRTVLTRRLADVARAN